MWKRNLLLLLLVIPFLVVAENETDSLPPLKGNWVQQLIATRGHINDPRINYPKFPKFCVKVYNWGDKTFNSYDPNYVVGTGKNWKASITSYNWFHNYNYIFQAMGQDNVSIRSNFYSDIGLNLSFMAVGISYTRNVRGMVGADRSPSNAFNFNFTCSRIYAEINRQKTHGNSFIDRFGQYKDGQEINVPFSGIHEETTSGMAYYIFNNKHYSRAAAYCYSKIQLRSAGSWMAGIRLDHQRVITDFTELPPAMLQYVPMLPLLNTFDSWDYEILGGYGYSFVLPHSWLLNFTALPSLGWRHSAINSTEPKARELMATNLRGRTSLTYNHNYLYLSLVGKYDGGFIFNKRYTFYNGTQSASFILGFRF